MEKFYDINRYKKFYADLGLYIAACEAPSPDIDIPNPPQFAETQMFFEHFEHDGGNSSSINPAWISNAQSLNYNDIDLASWREYYRRLTQYILACQSFNSHLQHANIAGFSFETYYSGITVPEIPLLYNIVNQIGTSTEYLQNVENQIEGQLSGNLPISGEPTLPVAPAQQSSPLQPLGNSISGTNQTSPNVLIGVSALISTAIGFIFHSHELGLNDLCVERKEARANKLATQENLVKELKDKTINLDPDVTKKQEAEIDKAVKQAKDEARRLINQAAGQVQELNIREQVVDLKARLGPRLSTAFCPYHTSRPRSTALGVRMPPYTPSLGTALSHPILGVGSALRTSWPLPTQVATEAFTTQFAENLIQTEAWRLDIVKFEQASRVLSVLAYTLCFLDLGALYNNSNAVTSIFTSQFTATVTGTALSEVVSWSPHVNNRILVRDLSALQAPGSLPLHTPSRSLLLLTGIAIRIALSNQGIVFDSDGSSPGEPGEN